MKCRGRHKWYFFTALVCIIALTNGCTNTQNIIVNPMEQLSDKEKIPLRALLVLTPGFCEFSYKSKLGYIYPLGETLCKYVENVIKESFSEVTLSSEKPLTSSQGVEIIITPQVVAADLTIPLWGWEDTEGVILIEWAMTDRGGNPIWVSTIRGEGRGALGNAFTFRAREREIMQKVVDDAFRKARASFLSSQEVKTFVASHK